MRSKFFLLFVLVFVKGQKNEGDLCTDEYTNSSGKCTPQDKCQSAKNDYIQNGIRPTFCDYSAFGSSLVCCRDGGSILQTPPKTTDRPVWGAQNTQNDGRRICEKKCVEYTRSVVSHVPFVPLLPSPEIHSVSAARCDYTGVELIVGGENALKGEFPHMLPYFPKQLDRFLPAHCDHTGVELIVGGENALKGEFPHMAAVGWSTFDGGYGFFCGGALISPLFVVTAGHCLQFRDPSVRDPAPVLVRLGDHNIDPSVDDGATPIDVPIRRTHKHPDYASPSTYNDIALLELASPVSFSSAIRPACLWTKPDFGDNEKAIATGWGVTNTDPRSKETAKVLQKVSLSLLDNKYCDILLASIQNRNWRGFRDTQMCAGELRGGKDTCQGDSGSPLQVSSKENHCIFHIVGVTSFGRRCAESGRPAIYSRIASYLDWIESVVWPNQ